MASAQSGRQDSKRLPKPVNSASRVPSELLAPVWRKETSDQYSRGRQTGEEDESRRWVKTKLWEATKQVLHLSSKCKGFFIAKPIVQNASLTSVSTVDGLPQPDAIRGLGIPPIGKALAQDRVPNQDASALCREGSSTATLNGRPWVKSTDSRHTSI